MNVGTYYTSVKVIALSETVLQSCCSLRVCGNHAAIGWWDPDRGVAMHDRGCKSWSTELSLCRGQSYEFKFVQMKLLSDGRSDPIWENGDNRCLKVPWRATAMDVICRWSDTSEMKVLVEELRYEEKINEMLSQQRAVEGGVVLAGSSIFRLWISAARDLAPLPIVNRAFGGSMTHEQLQRMNQIILPLKPTILVYYCGGNDINAGIAPNRIAANFFEFSRRLLLSCPQVVIVYVSIIKCPEKTGKFHLVDEANGLVQRYCSDNTACHAFLDINPMLFTNNGSPCYELYESDMLHFMPEAYQNVLGPALKPVLYRLWDSRVRSTLASLRSRI